MYKPPYNITEQMLKLISDISEKVGKIQGYHTLSTHPNLRKSNRIRSIHSSLAIEANSLSLAEVRDVIDGRTVIGNRDEIKEVQNAYRAYEAIQEINPFNMEDLKRMHGVIPTDLCRNVANSEVVKKVFLTEIDVYSWRRQRSS